MSQHRLPDSIEERINPIDTTAFTGDTTDLSVIDDQVSEASIVGLGEAAHGLRDCSTLKHRLFARLVTEHGFRLFGMETHLSEALAINEYVVHGEDDVETALETLEFWIWQTEAVKSFIEWMRAFNGGRPLSDRIRFYGLDVQSTKASASELTEFLKAVDPAFNKDMADALEIAQDSLQPHATDDETAVTDDAVRKCIDTVEALVADLTEQFETRKAEYVDATSERAYQMASRHLRLLEQATELAAIDLEHGRGVEYSRTRDQYMAENLTWIRTFEERDRIAVWAANGHLRKGNDHRDGPSDGGPLGYHLDQRFGSEYCALALEFGRGSAQTIDIGEDTAEFPVKELRSPPTNTLLGALFDQSSEPCYLDLGTVGEADTAIAWLEDAQPHSASVLAYDPEMEVGLESDRRVNFTWEFDGLFFIPEIDAAEPLPMVTARASE